MKLNIRIIIVVSIIFFVIVCVIFFVTKGISCNSKSELGALLDMDFKNVKIMNIQYQNSQEKDVGEYTYIYVFLQQSKEDIQSGEYYQNKLEPNQIPPGHIKKLKEIGIGINTIQQHGINWKEVKVWGHSRPYEIHWYLLDSSHAAKGNVLLLTCIPRKVVLNVDKIILE